MVLGDKLVIREKSKRTHKDLVALHNLSSSHILENDVDEFLNKQKEDLTNAENVLLEIITEMDDIMKDKFSSLYLYISNEQVGSGCPSCNSMLMAFT